MICSLFQELNLIGSKKSFSCIKTELEKHMKQYVFNYQKEGLYRAALFVCST